MANLVTVTSKVGAGIATGREGYGPVVRQRFDTSVDPIAANAVLWAVKIPAGSIPRFVMVNVKTIAGATCTMSVGTDKSATTVVNNVIASVNLETLGKTVAQMNLPTVATVCTEGTPNTAVSTVASAVTAAGDADYIVFKANHAMNGPVFDIAVFVDVLDPDEDID